MTFPPTIAQSCLQCGRLWPSDTEPSVPQAEGQSEAEFLNLEVLRRCLQTRMLASFYQRNAIQSTTRNLPPETLTLIFQHLAGPAIDSASLKYIDASNFCDDLEKTRSIFRCAAVSSLWRQIIMSTPTLWQRVAMKIDIITLHRSTELLQHCSRSSKTLPLALALSFHPVFIGGDYPQQCLETLARELFKEENAQRVKMLRLRDPPLPWTRQINAFPHLECLSLEFVNYQVTFNLLNLPTLRQLSLRGTWTSNGLSNAESITALELADMSLRLCVGIFIHCPNLVECHCHFPMYGCEREETFALTAGATTTFLHLKKWTWPLRAAAINEWLFGRLEMPVLEVLQLYGVDGHDCNKRTVSLESIISFFSRLPSSVSTLEMMNLIRWSRKSLVELFRYLPNLRSLAVHDCSKNFNCDVMSALTPGEDSDEAEYLPDLQTLTIKTSAMKHLNVNEIEKMVQKRGYGSKALCLIISRPSPMIMRRLEDIVEVDLEVLDSPTG